MALELALMLPRPQLERLVEQVIDCLDDLDGDSDLEAIDEREDEFLEQVFRLILAELIADPRLRMSTAETIVFCHYGQSPHHIAVPTVRYLLRHSHSAG